MQCFPGTSIPILATKTSAETESKISVCGVLEVKAKGGTSTFTFFFSLEIGILSMGKK